MRNKLLMILCIAVALLLAVICVRSLERFRSGEMVAAAPDETTESTTDTEPETESEEQIPPDTADDTQDPEEETTDTPASSSMEPTVPADTEQTPESISFPYQIPGTPLEIRSIESYDGIFLEDGSDREISGIAAAIICNVGDVPVEYARILLDGGLLEFTVTALNQNAIIIVQNASAAAATDRQWYECTADIAYMDHMEMSSGLIEVQETENGSLEVKNISGEDIPCLRVFYKFYMADQNVYVGGITYNFKILDLKAGQSQIITPSHYVSGYSKIVMIKTYDDEN